MPQKTLNHEEIEEELAKERTLLSKKRTILSNERTLLSYIRTSFTVFLFGIALIKFFEFNRTVLYIGFIVIAFGCGILIIGFISSVERNRKIKRL